MNNNGIKNNRENNNLILRKDIPTTDILAFPPRQLLPRRFLYAENPAIVAGSIKALPKQREYTSIT